MLEVPHLKEILSKPDDRVFVPMGVNCGIANFLRSAGLRAEAFPFDWNITPIQSAIELLENRFDRFFDLDTLTLLPSTERKLFREEDGKSLVKLKRMVTLAYCHRYSMLFPHDLADASAAELTKAQLKYRRRAQSMLSLLTSAAKPIFVVTEDRLSEWQLEQIGLAKGQFPDRPVDWETTLQNVLAQRGGAGEWASICALPSLMTAWRSLLCTP